MRFASRLLAVTALLALVGLLPARAQPREGFHLEDRIPASSMLFVSLEDLGSLGDRFEATALGRLFNDPEMQAFMAPIGEAVSRMMEGGGMEIPEELLAVLEQVQNLQGQVAIALVDIDIPQESVQAAVSLDFGDHVQDFVGFLEAMRGQLDPGGEAIRYETRGGRPFWSVDTGEVPIHATTIDTTFVLTTDEGLLESISAGPQPDSLGQSAAFQAVHGRLGGEDLAVLAYANVPAALSAFESQIPAEGRRVMHGLGLDAWQAVAYGLAFKGDGFLDSLAIYAPGATHGLTTLFQMEPLSAPRTLDLAPARTLYWAEGNLSLSRLLASVKSMVASIDESAVREMETGIAQAGDVLGVDLEREVLGGLGEYYGLYVALPDTGGHFPEVAIVLHVKDPATYEATFTRFTDGIASALTEHADVLATTRTMPYRGRTLHLMDLQAARGDDVVPFTPTWAIFGDRLVITLVPHAMKEIVLRLESPASVPGLAAQEDFQALWNQKPADAGAMEYLDLQMLLAFVYDTGVPLLQTLAKPNVMEDVPFPIDWARLPAARTVLPHLRSLAEYATGNEDGVVISFHAPVPVVPIIVVGVAAVAMGGFMMTRYDEPDWTSAPGVTVMPEEIEDERNLELARLQAEMLADTVEFFAADSGRLPGSLQDLVTAGLVDSLPEDPWGVDYRMERVRGGGFLVVSAGPDGQFGTPDDVRQRRD